jgi:Na+/proline symporter
MIVQPVNSQHLLSDLLLFISKTSLGKVVLFFVVLGLYGAMLSTASTNLIVVAHTISEDIIAPIKNITLSKRIDSAKEFIKSRIILTLAALAAIFVVVGLKALQFSIADLVFSIYGGALALFPLIMFALYLDRQRLNNLSIYASTAVIAGFIVGWGIAIYGKLSGDGNLIFLAPTFSIAISLSILVIGIIINKSKINES